MSSATPVVPASPPPRADPEHGVLAYDVRVRTVISPAFVASFPLRVARIVVPRRSVYRFRIAKDRDIADVVRRLSRAGVAIEDVRVLSLPG